MKRMIARTLFFILLIGAPINAYASSYIMHTVQQGDNVTTISQKYNISSNQINSLNGKSELYIGNLLKLRPIAGNKTIKVFLDNKAIVTDEAPYMEGGLTFVPIRFIAEAIGVKDINWNNDNEEAILMKNSVILRLPIRKTYAFINDETIELDAPINIYKGRTFVPLRFVAEAFDLNVEWDEGNAYVRLFTDQYVEKRSQETVISPVLSYSEEDIYWLSRIVEAEAGGEPYEGKLAVANCIINRKRNKDFPDTIKGVIFDRNWGVQYTPVANGTIYNNPSGDSIKAATAALEGTNNIGESLYFLNPRKATNNWIIKNRRFYRTIKNHDFYL